MGMSPQMAQDGPAAASAGSTSLCWQQAAEFSRKKKNSCFQEGEVRLQREARRPEMKE